MDMQFDHWGPPQDSFGDSDIEIGISDESWDTLDVDLDGDDDLVAPTAEQIRALMNQIGSAADSLPAASPPRRVESDVKAVERPVAHAASVQDVTIDSLDSELREAFMDDASNCLGSMEQSLLRLESDSSDRAALNQICRELHTLKGASASVGLSQLADQLHRLEDTLSEDHAAGRSPEFTKLLRSVDAIRAQILGAAPTSTATATDLVPGTGASFDDDFGDDEMVRVKSSQLNRLMDMLAELVMLRNRRETELSDLQEIYHELIGSVSKMRLLSHDTDSASIASSSLQLSEVANDVLEVAQQVRACARPISDGNAAVSQFIREFRQELVELRRTPIGGLFRRLQRVVRDAAQAEGKQVRLKLVGEDAGMERSLQQRLYEPLLHIVRNSVCHGIEGPDSRKRAGKDPCGVISLEASSGPDLFTIEICDDGRGLNYDAIRRRGIETGLLSADQSTTNQELSQLIFHPGFSTRQTADQIAGRGVGMDVVAATLQKMRGWIEVHSEADRGTRIRLSFPLPSVIQHAMVFRTANQLFALPMQSVHSTGKVGSASTGISFAQLVGDQNRDAPQPAQQISLAFETRTANTPGGVAHSRLSLLVDEVIGPEELVVRPLPSLLRHHPYCCGATLSGLGKTVLILDARRVVEARSDQPARISNPLTLDSSSSEYQSQPAAVSRPRVLVVDDSISARKRVVRSLRRYGVEIVEANDGKQAIEIIKREPFAAVFSDMEMPHVSGMELLAEIQSKFDHSKLPVVIISSRSEDEFTVRARELGANNYLIKPLSDEALDNAIVGIPTLQHLTANQTTESPRIGENR